MRPSAVYVKGSIATSMGRSRSALRARGLAVDEERAAKRRVAGVAQARGQLERAQGAGAGGRFTVFVHRVLSSIGWCHGRREASRGAGVRGRRPRRHP